MIRLSSIIETFESEFLECYQGRILPSQRKALAAIRDCRSRHSPRMLTECPECAHQAYVPHSCGHRSCPHCQQHESQQWLERQLKKHLPADYFLLTFTLPAELRPLAWRHQRKLYDLILRTSWETVRTFTHNDRQLRGIPGAVSVLHTHSRRLDFHPHVHLVMPAAALDPDRRLWRTKREKGKKSYLFNHQALARVFRAKLLNALTQEQLTLPGSCPEKWVVDCRSVGSGEKALLYLGRYLYRGVIQEKDIIACNNGRVTFRYRDGKTGKVQTHSLPGADFLWLLLQHVLPKGFRRTRNFGFLHPNSKRLITLLQYLVRFDPKRALALLTPRPKMTCPCCGAPMRILGTRLPPPCPTIPIVVPGGPCKGGIAMM